MRVVHGADGPAIVATIKELLQKERNGTGNADDVVRVVGALMCALDRLMRVSRISYSPLRIYNLAVTNL